MAEKRMFAKSIVNSDVFISMPLSAQALYVHLSMAADDDGFINNHKRIQILVGASDDDMQELIDKRYILVFDSGVAVIKHWKINNTIRKDRYVETLYLEEKEQIKVKKNGSYTEKNKVGKPNVNHIGIPDVNHIGKPNVNQNGNQMSTEYSIDQSSIDQNSIVDDINIYNNIYNSEDKIVLGTHNNIFLSEEEYLKLKELFPTSFKSKIEYLSNYCHKHNKTYPSAYETIITWAKRDGELQEVKPDKQQKSKNTMHYQNERQDDLTEFMYENYEKGDSNG